MQHPAVAAIGGARCAQRADVQEVRVDHGGSNVAVAEELLHGSEVGAVLEEVGGEGVAEPVAADALGEAGETSFHCGRRWKGRVCPPVSEPDLPPALFARLDESDDAAFYAMPRFVVHIDEATIAALTGWYAEALAAGADVLDLMSSWVSHLPPAEALPLGRVVGLGMNAEELAANPRLTSWDLVDLNAAPRLPYPDAAFDAVLCAVSIQYLTRPLEVFREVARVLRPGGRVAVATSHRCFPTKAIRAFHVLPAPDRLALIALYLERAGGFAPAERIDRSPPGADPLWIVTALRQAA